MPCSADGLQVHADTPSFYVSTEDLTLGPRIWVVSTLSKTIFLATQFFSFECLSIVSFLQEWSQDLGPHTLDRNLPAEPHRYLIFSFLIEIH